jgi:hypothetical protein
MVSGRVSADGPLNVSPYPHDACEAALAQIKGKTERPYQCGDLFDKHRALMKIGLNTAATARRQRAAALPSLRCGNACERPRNHR